MNTDAVSEVLRLFCLGVRDVFCGVYYYSCSRNVRTQDQKPSELQVFGWSTLKSTIFWIFIVNGILLGCSDYLLNLLFLGLVKVGLYVTMAILPDSSEYIWNNFVPAFRSWFPFLWIVPLFIISRFTNWWWFQDIADMTYKTRTKPGSGFGITDHISDLLCTTLLQILFLVQCGCLSFIPDAGFLVYLFHMCLLYSMYAFEYKWCNYGWQLPKRIMYIECNWPYFIGFGLPLATLTSLTNDRVVNLGIFSFLFPVCIISGNNSKPPIARHSYRIPAFSIAGFLTNKCCEKIFSRR